MAAATVMSWAQLLQWNVLLSFASWASILFVWNQREITYWQTFPVREWTCDWLCSGGHWDHRSAGWLSPAAIFRREALFLWSSSEACSKTCFDKRHHCIRFNMAFHCPCSHSMVDLFFIRVSLFLWYFLYVSSIHALYVLPPHMMLINVANKHVITNAWNACININPVLTAKRIFGFSFTVFIPIPKWYRTIGASNVGLPLDWALCLSSGINLGWNAKDC